MTRPGPVYLDNHSTTPVDPEVLEAMLPFFAEGYGNAASTTHRYGWEARDAVEAARSSVGSLVGANPRDIVFTSGATESDNIALSGVAHGRAEAGRHIVTAVTEHKAVLDTIGSLERQGFLVTYLPVDRSGRVDLDQLEESIRDDTVLVSLMAVNNEIGTMHPIAEIAEVVEPSNALLHVDAAQSLTYGSLDLSQVPADLVSISSHKMYGPKGVGALYVRPSAISELAPTVFGGGHERGLRSGTLNVPAIVGLGAASSIVESHRDQDAVIVARLRDSLEGALVQGLPDLEIAGINSPRHPGNLNVIFRGVDAQTLLNRLRNEVAASTGSACTAATPEASHVLVACGFTHDEGMSAVRFGLGRQNTPEEIAAVAAAIVEHVQYLRAVPETERGAT